MHGALFIIRPQKAVPIEQLPALPSLRWFCLADERVDVVDVVELPELARSAS